MRPGGPPLLGAAVAIGLLWSAPQALAGNEVAALPPLRADRVVVLKSQRRMLLLSEGRVVRAYRVALGRYPRGTKIREGDSRTPEGRYVLDYRLDDSAFYKSIHISYPNSRDQARAEFLGVDPGGKIMIHGLPPNWSARRLNHPYLDWTDGCIAVTNREMDEIWALVEDGTPIDIRP